MKKILIVEDEKNINQLIYMSLKTVGYQCFQAYYGMEALGVLAKEAIDLVLLDVNLPDSDGFNLIKSMPQTPVIYLTARDTIEDRVTGLNLGAEDYLIKPFALDELIARVQVVLRRFNNEDKQFIWGDLVIDLEKQQVQRDQKIITLTPQEFSLLTVFIRHKNMALSRTQLLELAWGMDYQGEERTVDVHVQRLRKKLNLETNLTTVYKLGYRLEVG